MDRLVFLALACLLGACGGGSPAASQPAPAAPAPPQASPPVAAAPLLPDVEGEVIGMPGEPVPGLGANYVWTGLGWLGPQDDVVFEALVRFRPSLELGCGIFRRGADGTVNAVLLQGQGLPGTGGGTVKHPGLPVESSGDLMLLPALVEGGTIAHGLFAVSKRGGVPALVHGETSGTVSRAEFAEGGAVIAEVVRGNLVTILLVEPGGTERVLCTGCAGGFSTDGRTVVVRTPQGAEAIALDGATRSLLRVGDPAPGGPGVVRAVLDARITPGGEVIVHATTDDATRPALLLRGEATGEVVAASGAPAPGTLGRFGALFPAAGRGEELLFGAALEDDPDRSAGIFLARQGAPPALLAGDGLVASGLPHALAPLAREAVSGGEDVAAFAAAVFRDGERIATGVFLSDGIGGARRLLTTQARAPTLDPSIVIGFDYELRDAVRVAADGRVLVHAMLRLDRLPEASLGALILLR